jgi:hypothetical protein
VAAHLLELGVELLRDVMGKAFFTDHGRILVRPFAMMPAKAAKP